MAAPHPVQYPPPYDPRPLLDIATERMRQYDPRPWGARPAVLPVAALLVLIVAASTVGRVVHPSGHALRVTLGIALTIGMYAVLALAVWSAGAGIASRYGGWGNAFGLRRPSWWDVRWIAAGAGMVLASRVAIGVVAGLATHGDANRESQNLELGTHSVASYVVIGIVVVLLAPVIEELVFRGLLLRTLMRRVSFWPAALASSAAFGVFHTYEVQTLAGATVLGLVTFSLGMVNCLLVRWSERLTPGIAVHMLFNGLALLVLILTA